MASVTRRIKEVKQPYGGYINPKQFECIEFDDGIKLNAEENIHAALVGLAVDYLTRYMMGAPIQKAFEISLIGAIALDNFMGSDKEIKKAAILLAEIDGINDTSIINACKVVGYDVCYRSSPIGYVPVETIRPNYDTVDNIAVMLKRSNTFFKKFGPIVMDGFNFEGAYTKVVTAGDGDFLTTDTLWDFKVSKKAPTKEQSLQLLMYYVMGRHTDKPEFKNIKRLGIFNPRTNKVYLLNVADIPQDIIDKVSREVIGYK